jgi:hypothetical protein
MYHIANGAPLLVALAATMIATPTSAQSVRNTSYVTSAGERVLRHEAEVDAPMAEVWRTLTTSEGLRSFLAPVVAVDFRVGGKWEASYAPNGRLGEPGNIVNEIVTFLPMEMFTTKIVQTPPTFQNPEVAKSVWTVYQLQPVTEHRTRILVSMVGWKTGPEWDAVYRFFDRGNTYTMTGLQRRFVEGPRKW